MDIDGLDQIFALNEAHTNSEWVTYRRRRLILKRDIEHWLISNKVEYILRPLGGLNGQIHIKNRRWAVLFKLTWL